MLLSEAHPAWRYACALRDGDWDAAVEMTAWMRERLEKVNSESGDSQAVAAARAALVRDLSTREAGGNHLRPEGIEDQYVFAPGVALRAVRGDRGHADLEPSPVERIWVRVTFPGPSGAPLDISGRPVRTMTVGVNMDPSGRVLKAAVTGNMDIDWASLSCDWGSVSGG